MEINWFLPTGGTDGRYLGTTQGNRIADFAYLQLRFGIRLHIIVRETTSEAWDAANELIKHLDEKTIQAAQSLPPVTALAA